MLSMFYFSQNNYDISIATNAEANQILYLLKDVAPWPKENDIDQCIFLADGGDDEEIKQSIQNHETYCVKKDGELIGT